MIVPDLQRVIDQMRERLDDAITKHEDGLADGWSDAIEAAEATRRIMVKILADEPASYTVISTEPMRDVATVCEENIAMQFKAEYKAAAITPHRWHYLVRRTGRDTVLTPYGVCRVYASDTCPDYYVEWLA